MPLPAGTRLGPYQITGMLGAGGMGEVYRARDSKLGRDVAIKILPAAFTTDGDRLARFEREARLLATLNHPNIGAICGIEESTGLRALVLELVEGDTLAGPLPIETALNHARQRRRRHEVADADDAGHASRRDHGHRRVHEPRAGQWETGRQANRHLVVRRGPLGSLDGPPAF